MRITAPQPSPPEMWTAQVPDTTLTPTLALTLALALGLAGEDVRDTVLRCAYMLTLTPHPSRPHPSRPYPY